MTDHRWSVATAPPSGVEIWAIVVAAGSGLRFGDGIAGIAKQYLPLGGSRVLDHSLALMRERCGERVVLVVRADRVDDPEPGAGIIVCGGPTRTDSVRAGLAAVAPTASVILVHDAARPLVPVEVIDRLILAITDGADGAVPGVTVVDTVKVIDDAGAVVATPPRALLRAVQTPQAFRAEMLRRVLVEGADATDDAALVEQAGGRVVVVDGDPLARKITTDDDLEWLSEQLRLRIVNPGTAP